MHRIALNAVFYVFAVMAVVSAPFASYVSLFFFAAALVIYFILDPLSYPLKPRDQKASPTIAGYEENKELLLALELSPPNPSFAETDWDASWLTFLERRKTDLSIGARREIESLEPGQYQTVVLAGKGWGRFSENAKTRLLEFVKRGGRLILARPYPGLEIFFGESPFTSLQEFLQAGFPANSGLDSFKIHFRDGVHTVFFDYGAVSIAMRQGLPNDNFTVNKKARFKIRQVNSFDLSLFHKQRPSLLMDELDDRIAERLALPKAIVGRKIILTHDEDYYGPLLADVVCREHKEFGITSVNFIMADSRITDHDLRRILDAGSEIGIHWNRFIIHADKTGLHYNPFRTLSSQIESLQRKLPKEYKVRSNRAHWLKWDNSYFLPWETMSGAGIEVDATLGAWLGKQGPLFGTMRPYRVLGHQGRPLPLLEIPYIGYDNINWIKENFHSGGLEREGWITILSHPLVAMKNLAQKGRPFYGELLRLRDMGFAFTTFESEINRWKTQGTF